MHKSLRMIVGLAATLMASGCVSLQTPITDFATDYNRVIADTGSGHDIFSRTSVKKKDWDRRQASERILELYSANGTVESASFITCFSKMMGGRITPNIVEKSPDVSSVGYR